MYSASTQASNCKYSEKQAKSAKLEKVLNAVEVF